jgi:hypothetical protein
MTLYARIARARTFFEKGDFLPILALVIAVQGTVLVSQSVAALLLDTAEVGRIRLFESMISIGVLIAGFGAPALAIREMAAPEHAECRGEMLRDLLILPVMGAIMICVAVLIAALFGATWILPWRDVLFASTLLLVAVNLVRMASAVAQGLVIVRHVYIWVIVGSIMAASMQIAGAAFGSISGWITGRLLGEIALLGSMLFAMRRHFPDIHWHQRLHLGNLFNNMLRATIVNAGLILRMLADAAPILLLGGVFGGLGQAASGDDIGHFGIATLFLTACLLPLSVMSQRALPLITTARQHGGSAAIPIFRRHLLLASILIALTMSGALILVSLTNQARQDQALWAGAALMLAVPMKAVASGIGTIMLAHGELKLPVWITLAELLTILMVFACSGTTDVVWTAVLSVIIGSGMSLVSMLTTYRLRYGIF